MFLLLFLCLFSLLAIAIKFVTRKTRVAYIKVTRVVFRTSCLKFSRAFKAIDLTPVVSPFAFRSNIFPRGEPFVSESDDGEFMKESVCFSFSLPANRAIYATRMRTLQSYTLYSSQFHWNMEHIMIRSILGRLDFIISALKFFDEFHIDFWLNKNLA